MQQGGIYGRYLPTRHLAYVREGTLFAAPFDLGRLEVTGPPAPIVEDVQTSLPYWSAQFDFSQTGTLVYLSRLDFRPPLGTTEVDIVFDVDTKEYDELFASLLASPD